MTGPVDERVRSRLPRVTNAAGHAPAFGVALFVTVGAAYLAGSWASWNLFGADEIGLAFFPPAGVTLAALVCTPRRWWPVVLTAAAAAEIASDLVHGAGTGRAVGFAAANTIEPLVSAVLLGGWISWRESPELRRRGDLVRFVAAGVVAGPLVGGAVGAWVVSSTSSDPWAETAARWAAGDGLGALAVGAPIVLFWTRRAPATFPRVELVLLALGASGAAFLAFVGLPILPSILVLPVLMLAAFRLGVPGVAVVAPITCVVANAAIAAQDGSDVLRRALDAQSQLTLTQLLLGVLIVTAWLVAIDAGDRLVLAERLVEERIERERLHRREALGRIAAELAGASSSGDVIEVVARHVRHSEGATFVALNRRLAGTDRFVEVAGELDEAARAVMSQWDLATETPGPTAVRTGTPVHVASLAELVTRFPAAAALAGITGVQSLAALPLTGPAGPSGYLVVGWDRPRRLEEHHREQLDAIAALSAQALERAHLLELTEEARERAEREADEVRAQRQLIQELFERERAARERAEVLEHNARRLASARTTDEIARAVVVDLRRLGLDGVTVRLTEPGAAPVPTRATFSIALRDVTGTELGALDADVDPDTLDPATLAAVAGVAEQTGLALERTRFEQELGRVSARATFLAALGHALDRRTTVDERAACFVTMVEASFPVSARVVLGDDRPPPRPSSPGVRRLRSTISARGGELGVLEIELAGDAAAPLLDEGFVASLGGRLGLALDNARLYEQERTVSHTLQLALLAGSLSEIAGTTISTAYLPGSAALEVGGDWYDAFELDDGSVALVVGDVVGHGLEAAVAMGRLRGAIRALAPGLGPAALIEGLDTFVEGLSVAEMATLTYLVYSPATGGLVYSAAGHPPPLVLRDDGGTEFLWGGRSTPIGCGRPGGRIESAAWLRPGDALVLYTDGLVERRGEALDVGLARLAAAAQRCRPVDASFALRLSHELLDPASHDDDACTMAIALDPCRRLAGRPG